MVAAPWGLSYVRLWERLDDEVHDLLVCPMPTGLWCELVHRYTGHPLICWRECLSEARWMTNHEVCIVAKSRLADALAKAKAAGVGTPAVDVELEEAFPILYALMTELRVDARTVRQPSSITVFTQDGMWKCCIVEKDENKSLFGSGDTLWGALANVEARLDSPIVDWRERDEKRRKK
jgi:hypothetical protein